jgi:hypothetical protein
MWESQRDFQRVWEGWKASFMALHAFHPSHTLSFPWSASEAKSEFEVAEISFSEHYRIHLYEPYNEELGNSRFGDTSTTAVGRVK